METHAHLCLLGIQTTSLPPACSFPPPSHQVVHKKMALRIPPAGEGKGLTLLLLAGSVEYLRSNKYTSIASLSTLVTQDQEAGKLRGMVEEEEYLRVAVERILMQRPDLLLLEGFMGKAGLDLLRNAGVTVVMNVKHKGASLTVLACVNVLSGECKILSHWLASCFTKL